MSIAETAAFGPYYETSSNLTPEQKKAECPMYGALCSIWCALGGGIGSTYTITLLTSKVWPDATYTIPLVTAVAGGIFLASAFGTVNATKLSSKIAWALPGIVSCIPFSPFLIGALPGIAITALTVCPAICVRTQSQIP